MRIANIAYGKVTEMHLLKLILNNLMSRIDKYDILYTIQVGGIRK